MLATSENEFVTWLVKWNNQRKAAVAVLALAGAAFCVDRFVLGYGPRSASAADTISAIITPTPAASTAPAAPVPTTTLSRKVSDLVGAHSATEFPDALRIPTEWSSLLAEPPKQNLIHIPDAKETPVEAPTFVVSSVFLGASAKTTGARINNKLILLNQSISGYTLLHIVKGNPSTVVLSGPRGELRVPLTIGGTNANPGADEPAPTTRPG